MSVGFEHGSTLMRQAFRSLRRTPAFTVSALVTLTLGVAAAGAMFAVLHGVLLAPLPYREPDRLVAIALQTPDQRPIGQPPALHQVYAQHAQRLDGVGFHRSGNANIGGDGRDEAPERVLATWVSASTLPLLGVTPLLGRTFVAEEERRDGPQAVILSEAEWRQRFQAAPDVIGRSLVVNSVPRQIVGVLPRRFAFPTAETRLWLPARFDPDAGVGDFIHAGVGRLAPGATTAEAQAELAAVLPRMAEAFPRLASGGSTAEWWAETRPRPVVNALQDELTRGFAPMLWVLAAAAGLVLLVAWANMANLMLVRADARSGELALREALGAGRWRIAVHFLGESLLLGAAAGAIAVPVVAVAVRALVAFGPADLPRLSELGVGLPSIGFMAGVAALGVVVCTVVPALRIRGTRRPIALRDSARGESAGIARQRVREGVAALQIALALAVTAGSALLLRTAWSLNAVHPGFESGGVILVGTQLPFARYDDADAVAFYTRLAERAAQLPSVTAAGVAMAVPLRDARGFEETFRPEGGAPALSLPVNVVDDGYFDAMRIPLLAGRVFADAGVQRERELVLSQGAAARLFGDARGTRALGRSLSLAPSGPEYTVVGIVGDVRVQDLAVAPSAMVYRPQVVPRVPALEPAARRAMALVLRSDAPPGIVVPAIRRIVHELDPGLPLFDIASMDEVVRASKAQRTLAFALTTTAAAIALLLGMIGLYGVMAYWVALRTREFGIRLALGADTARIFRIVAGRGLVLTAVGIVAGLLVYALGAPLLRAFLYGVTETDPGTLAAAALLVAAASAFATALPARRAARVDPAVALRSE